MSALHRVRRSARTSLRALVVAALSTALLVSLAAPAYASGTWVVDTTKRTESDIWAKWSTLKPTHTGATYGTAPKVTAPYAAGSLTSGFLGDGLKTLNFARYLAGLPDDVVLSSPRTYEAQHGAVLLAAAGVLSHSPPRPSQMTQTFYDTGLASTTTSNVGRGYKDLVGFQLGCLNDQSSAGNLERVGHRRWLLNPPMKATGMGFANGWVTTYVFDRSRTQTVQYSMIAWPSAGAFPVQMFASQTPWSVSLNPAQYDIDPARPHSVTLRRVADGRTWTFSDRTTSTSGQYFRVDFSRMGIPNVFIFRPDPASVTYRDGDQFDVTLSVYVKGQSAPRYVSYRTRFVSLYEKDRHEPDDTMATASRLLVGQVQPRTFHRDGDQDWVYFDAQAGVKLQIASPGVPARLHSSAGTLIKTFSGGIKAEDWTPPSTGRYYLLLEGGLANQDATRYKLSVINPAVRPTTVMGDTRYETAVEASKLAFPSGASTVVIATGRSWPDALGGTALAGVLGGPILLTDTNSIPAAVSAEMTRLKATRAIIVGGTGVVSTKVEDALKSRFGSSNVERIAGSDRYQTADRIASRVIELQGSSYDGRAFVATGADFPDALAAAPVAASQGWPLFLVKPSSAPSAAVRTAMAPVTEVTILGGTGVVSSAVQAELERRFGTDGVERVAGGNRYATAAEVALWATENTGLGWAGVALATGRSFPDALAGGVLQGKRNSVMLLTHPQVLSAQAADLIGEECGCISQVTFLGGPGAVSYEVRNEVIEVLY